MTISLGRITALFLVAVLTTSGLGAQMSVVADGGSPTQLLDASVPPALPLPYVRMSERGAMRVETQSRLRAASDIAPPGAAPGGDSAFLSLSAGLSLISIPLRTESETLSELFGDLPDGSRVWTWDRLHQRFVEGFDQPLPLGHGAVLYLPVPALIMVHGEMNLSTSIVTDLGRGWNLIGVPYSSSLQRSHQNVIADFAKITLDEAVAEKEVGDLIFTRDERGYQIVGPHDSFEPMHAYWIHSVDADAMELRPTLLTAGDSAEMWVVKQVGAATISWTIGHFLTLWTQGPDRDAQILAQMSDIANQVNNINETQNRIELQLDAFRRRTSTDKVEILSAVLAQKITEVQSALENHYQKPIYNSNAPCAADGCYRLLVDKALKNPTSVTEKERRDFAYNVLFKWNFKEHETAMHRALMGGDSLAAPSLLRLYGEWVETATTKGTFEDRLRQFFAFFNQQIGYQIQIMTLVTTASEQLENIPKADWDRDYPGTNQQPTKGDGERWRKGTYADNVRAQYELLREIVETAAINKLQIPEYRWPDNPDTRGAVLPANAQFAFQLMDFVWARAWEDPFINALRIRLLVNPDLLDNEVKLWSAVCPAHSAPSCIGELIRPVPRLSSWKTVKGPKMYDSWGWDPQGGMAMAGPGRQFQWTNEWKVTTVTFSPLYTPGLFKLKLVKDYPGWQEKVEEARVEYYDGLYNRTTDTSASLFQSVTLVNRPTANQMFNPAIGCTNPPSWDVARGIVRNYCNADISWPSGCNIQQIRACYAGTAETLLAIPFRYIGPPDVASRLYVWADWRFEGDASDRQCGNTDSNGPIIDLGYINPSPPPAFGHYASAFRKPLAIQTLYSRNIQYMLRLRNQIGTSPQRPSECNSYLTFRGMQLLLGY